MIYVRSFLKTDESGLPIPCPAPKLSKTPGVSQVSGNFRPEIGQHTTEVLQEFGFSKTEIDGLVNDGIVTISENCSEKSKL